MPKKQLPVISKDGSAEEAQKIAECFAKTYKNKKLDLPISRGKAMAIEPLGDWLKKKAEEKAAAHIERGIGFLQMKKYLGHGMFGAWLQQNDFSSSSARKDMQVVEMLYSLSDSNRPRVADLPFGKQKVLATAPPIMLEDLLDNDEITEEMSREQMREIIRLQKKVDDLSGKLDTSEEEKHAALQAAKNKRKEERFPSYVQATREEATTLSDEIEINLEKMERLFHTLLDQVAYTKSDEDAQRFLQIAETSLYHNLNGVVARATPLLLTMREQYGKEVTGPVVDLRALYTNEESVEAIKNREMLLQKKAGEEEIRKIERDVKNRSTRGRKKVGKK